MRVDEDLADDASVEDWLASVPFDGVRIDKKNRWLRVLAVILKYARRFPAGVWRCVSVTAVRSERSGIRFAEVMACIVSGI